jgi:cell fate (sporulation/competence/biofilm development) regulator YlbF (YheA/YmcA/DUF963 family)
MSIETTPDSDETPPAARATDLASDLGDAITDLPAYREFREAKEAVESSEEAQEKIETFEQKREEFMLARQTGNASNEDLRDLQAAQEELHDIPVMDEYLRAQSDLELQLQELNEMISAPLSVDFGEKAGGCCQD